MTEYSPIRLQTPSRPAQVLSLLARPLQPLLLPPPLPSLLPSTSRHTPTSSTRSLEIASGSPTLPLRSSLPPRPSQPPRPSTLSDTFSEPRRSATSCARLFAKLSLAPVSRSLPPRLSRPGSRTTATPSQQRPPPRPSLPPPPTRSHRFATPTSLASRTGSSAPRLGRTILDPRDFTTLSPLAPTSTFS